MRKKLKGNKGITLVALVITIVVLLILAGVVVGTLSSNGIIEKAKDARDETSKVILNDESTLSELEKYIDDSVNNKKSTLEILKEQYSSSNNNMQITVNNMKTIGYTIKTQTIESYTINSITNFGQIVFNSTIGDEKNITIDKNSTKNGSEYKYYLEIENLYYEIIKSDNSIEISNNPKQLNEISDGFIETNPLSFFCPNSLVEIETISNTADKIELKLTTLAIGSGMLQNKDMNAPDAMENPYTYITLINSSEYACCFDPGSKILMADGTTKNIEDIKIGDKVMSLNEDTGEFVCQMVSNAIVRHNSDDLVYVHLDDGTTIGMRAYHPLLTTEGYKSLRPELAITTMEAGKKLELLKIGDILVGYNKNSKIVNIETREEIENYDTYNLTIDGYSNYIVNGYVVHNMKEPCPYSS